MLYGESVVPPLRGYVFTDLSACLRPFGDPLSVLTERGERATKGLRSRPLETGFLYGGSEGRRAHSVRVRRNAIDAI